MVKIFHEIRFHLCTPATNYDNYKATVVFELISSQKVSRLSTIESLHLITSTSYVWPTI